MASSQRFLNVSKRLPICAIPRDRLLSPWPELWLVAGSFFAGGTLCSRRTEHGSTDARSRHCVKCVCSERGTTRTRARETSFFFDLRPVPNRHKSLSGLGRQKGDPAGEGETMKPARRTPSICGALLFAFGGFSIHLHVFSTSPAYARVALA